jgi:PAS domain S-box-containing protein
MPDEVSFQPSDAVRRWTRALGDLRLRLDRKRRRPEPRADGVSEAVTEEAVDLCGMLLRETAAAELEVRRIAAQQRDERQIHKHLFNKLPIACVITDASGYIKSANRAAALLLGVSAPALQGRLLLLFAEDRAGFQDLLQARDGSTHYATLTLRPRELRPLKVQVTLAPDAPRDATGWLWFMQPHEKFLSPGAPNPTPSK